MAYPIPKSSADAWQVQRSDPKTARTNPGLIFERFAPSWYAELDDANVKKAGLIEVWRASRRADPDLFGAWKARWLAGVNSAGAKTLRLKTDWRFIAGLGRKGPLEVGFTFHRYGFPILPGSCVKGIARAWGLALLAESLPAALGEMETLLLTPKEADFNKLWQEQHPQAKPEIKLLADDFRQIFGTQDQAGAVVFWDAIPHDFPRLEIDVMNPHFPDYYQRGEKPTNWQNPIPIFFLTVAGGVSFNFAAGLRTLSPQQRQSAAQALLDRALEWLNLGLQNLGAGAKTSAGYGFFVE